MALCHEIGSNYGPLTPKCGEECFHINDVYQQIHEAPFISIHSEMLYVQYHYPSYSKVRYSLDGRRNDLDQHY